MADAEIYRLVFALLCLALLKKDREICLVVYVPNAKFKKLLKYLFSNVRINVIQV